MLNPKKTILFITTCCTLFSCISESEQKIKNDKGNYSITKLANWDYEIKNRSTIITQSREFDSLAVAASIIIAPGNIDPGNSEISLDKTFTAIKLDLSNNLKDFQKINEGYTEINGNPTMWLKLSYTFDNIKFISLRYYLMLSDTTPVMVDCSSISGTFEEFEPDFNKMVFSFRVEN